MKIVVCIKQVPDTVEVKIDPKTGTLIRDGVPSIINHDDKTGAMKRMSGETRTNPYDLFALETALAIREKTGGTVTVLTMGPPQAEEMIRDAYTMGADEGVILSDRKFVRRAGRSDARERSVRFCHRLCPLGRGGNLPPERL